MSEIKPSIVGVGLYDPLGVQTHQLMGSGFVFGDGSLVATNHHVVSLDLDPAKVQHLIIFSGVGRSPKIQKVQVIAIDPSHDLAILKLEKALPPITLADDEYAPDGTEILLTGFPIGAVLGLFPATHRGIIAATSPDVIPSANSRGLSTKILRRLDEQFLIYQLDITAYPGNSGSPVYDSETGDVIGVLNKVFVKESKESALEKPSGISYAIPIKYLKALAKSKGIML
ncbi:MAG: serine protease [Paraglaciecola sp.]|uniref:S1 family peptidase n=1 Tax=Paraglaciecola sp. TaxID=1920173 RepID=UPI00326654DB